MKKKRKKNKNFNINQTSFYFEDYIETNRKNKYSQNNFFQDRIYLLFFLFFSLILIFSLRIVHVSMNKIEIFNQESNTQKFTLLRRDIIDRNGELISTNVKSFHAAINPNLLKNKENFLIKLRLNFPDLPIRKIKKRIEKGKYFYLKKRINQVEKEMLWNMEYIFSV